MAFPVMIILAKYLLYRCKCKCIFPVCCALSNLCAVITQLQIDKMYCPNYTDFQIQGNINSNLYKYFELNINRCNYVTSGVVCNTDEEINNIIQNTDLNIYQGNIYFDFDDYEQPIETYLDDRFFFTLIPGFTKTNLIKIQKNEAEIQDDYLAYLPGGTNKEFITLERFDQRLSIEGAVFPNIISFKFIKDSHSKSYERGVFTLREVIGSVGGLMGIFICLGGIIVNIFSSKLFYYSIFSQMYQIEHPCSVKESKSSSYESKEASTNRIFPVGTNYDDKIQNDLHASSHQESSRNESMYIGLIKEEMTNKTLETIKRRVKYNWKIEDLIYNILGVLKFIFYCFIKKKATLNVKKRLQFYQQGEQKFIKKFDAVNFVQSLRNLKALTNSLFNEKEIFMVKYQRSNALVANENSEKHENKKKGMPKIFTSIVEKALYNMKVKRIMTDYNRDEWQDKDAKLFHGVYSETPLTSKTYGFMKHRQGGWIHP
ncbi:unnamed protein product [Moneuplotes crassus]|uniref:Uncharacterized protein n=1 Tax=Euplotes crassus TaxID=5936 RepID=A0AAD1XUV3_EUPCR|nr:unnamed protein product [Moneuplotes crassus]